MTPASSKCNTIRLQQSLCDRLSEQQEEQLALHLTQCEPCRKQLEEFAGDAGSWRHIGDALRSECSGAPATASPADSAIIPLPRLSGEHGEEFNESPALKPSDFIVDFLQPAQNKESLGRLGNCSSQCHAHPACRFQPTTAVSGNAVCGLRIAAGPT